MELIKDSRELVKEIKYSVWVWEEDLDRWRTLLGYNHNKDYSKTSIEELTDEIDLYIYSELNLVFDRLYQ